MKLNSVDMLEPPPPITYSTHLIYFKDLANP